MDSVLFDAVVRDGQIEIPAEYREVMQQATTVQVKLVQKKRKKLSETRILGKMMQNPVLVDRFLTREESNDRYYDR
ncbi:MAG: hypothetical protein MUF49_04270 [Oculatellaceae cyanobacterium Prado106]|nr:hypothetical protein [Oculatellaceae cyanobacterium Prado106]